MNAPSTFPPTIQAIAARLEQGDFGLLPDGDYTGLDMPDVASDCLAGGDFTDLEALIAYGMARIKYHEVVWTAERRGDWGFGDRVDFDDWFERDAYYWKARAAESYIPAGGAA